MEARVFQVVRLCEPTSTVCSQWTTSLLYSLCIIFWMITMYYEVSYLYIGLLTQLSYLTYVGFLNTFNGNQESLLYRMYLSLVLRLLDSRIEIGSLISY
jgi:hypothetical protein